MYRSKPPIGALSVLYRTHIYWSLCNDTDDGCVSNKLGIRLNGHMRTF